MTSLKVKLNDKTTCIIDYPGDVYGIDGIRLSFYNDERHTPELCRRPDSVAELMLLLTLHAAQRKTCTT